MASARRSKSASSNSRRRLSRRTVTKKNRSKRNGRCSRDTPLEYRTVDGMTNQAADLKDGGLRYVLFGVWRLAKTPGRVAGAFTAASFRGGSPIEPLQTFNQVEVAIAAQDGHSVLATERRNPCVVGWNRSASLFQLDTQLRVPMGGFFIDIQHC